MFWSNDWFLRRPYYCGMPRRKLSRPSSELRPKRAPTAANQQTFFFRLGKRVRELRRECGHSQEDMIASGFSARHWQQIEAGRPITVTTLLRICAIFDVSAEGLVRGLDKGIY